MQDENSKSSRTLSRRLLLQAVSGGVVLGSLSLPGIALGGDRLRWSGGELALEQEARLHIPAGVTPATPLRVFVEGPHGVTELLSCRVSAGEELCVQLRYPYDELVCGEYRYLAVLGEHGEQCMESRPLTFKVTGFQFGW